MIKEMAKYKVASKLLKQLNSIERFQGLWEHTVHQQSPHFIKELKKTTIITSSGASTRIEGATLSDAEVRELVIKGCKISKMSSRSEREVSGYVKALKYIYANFKKLPVTESSVREIHQLLTSDLLAEHLPLKQRGAYKDITNDVIERDNETGKETVWFKTTPPGPQTEVEMKILMEEISDLFKREEVNLIIGVASFVVHFLAIHPFRDGNGRVSRLLTIWLLLKANYSWVQYSSHEKVIEDNKPSYYVNLRNTQKTLSTRNPKYEGWFSFFSMVLEKQTEFIEGKIKRESPKSELNSNEEKVYEVIKEHGKVSPSFLLKHVDMTSNGLKSLLQRLSERGLIEPIGEKRGRKYKFKN